MTRRPPNSKWLIFQGHRQKTILILLFVVSFKKYPESFQRKQLKSKTIIAKTKNKTKQQQNK